MGVFSGRKKEVIKVRVTEDYLQLIPARRSPSSVAATPKAVIVTEVSNKEGVGSASAVGNSASTDSISEWRVGRCGYGRLL